MNQVMQCPLCSGEMTITPDLAGRDVRCPHCKQEIHIPGGPPPLSPAPPGYAQPGYTQPGYMQQPYREIPSYLVQAILTTLCCCLPFGIVAIVYAANANSKKAMGDYAGALQAANSAKTWCWVAFICGLVIGAVSFFVNMAAMQHGASRPW